MSCVVLKARSGVEYAFDMHHARSALPRLPGLYIFCKRLRNGDFLVLYVGQTHDFSTGTIDVNHPGLICATSHDCTHVGTRVLHAGEQSRIAAQADLCHTYNPPCNLQ